MNLHVCIFTVRSAEGGVTVVTFIRCCTPVAFNTSFPLAFSQLTMSLVLNSAQVHYDDPPLTPPHQIIPDDYFDAFLTVPQTPPHSPPHASDMSDDDDEPYCPPTQAYVSPPLSKSNTATTTGKMPEVPPAPSKLQKPRFRFRNGTFYCPHHEQCAFRTVRYNSLRVHLRCKH